MNGDVARLPDNLLQRRRIAYFSMEIALRAEIPTYSGGLGVLAGDTLRSAADLRLPLVGVTLVSRQGYLRQEIGEDDWQRDLPDPWDPARWTRPIGAKVTVEIAGRAVWVQAWLYLLEGGTGGSVPVLLLDTDLPENHPEDRRLTDLLYGGDREYRLRQEMVLGIGGVRLLRALGFSVEGYHLNEGHSALLVLELARFHERRDGGGLTRFDLDEVRRRCVFTTHTPVEAGHDRFSWELVERLMRPEDVNLLREALEGESELNMTCLALRLSAFVNGVAKRHAEVSRRLYPGYRVHAITNGVHPDTWAHPALAALYDRFITGWRHEPELLVRAEAIDDGEIWKAHRVARESLFRQVRERAGVQLDHDRPVIGFARRMTGYKRPTLIFEEPERLRAIHRKSPFQLLVAGKAHPQDGPGKEAIRTIVRIARELEAEGPRVVFLPDYDMALARHLVAGCDVWLNTPLPPMEASGTSGMKAAFNGVLNLSILDGWWLEGCIEGVTGWAIGNGEQDDRDGDVESLYTKLEQVVLPTWYGDRRRWIWMMKQAIGKNAYYFNSHRMMRRYATDAYYHFL